MGFSLFKDADEHFEQGVDYVKQGEYDKAVKSFQKSVEKGTKNSAKATMMINFINLGSNLNNPSYYRSMASCLRSSGSGSFEFGLSTFDCDKLATECEAMSNCISARAMDPGNNNDRVTKGKALVEAAMNLQIKVGEEILQVNQYFNNRSISGKKMALALMAEGNEIISDGMFWEDPQKAAEYQQIAYNFRRQLGESGDDNQRRIQQYTKSCTCWICGRQVMGEGLHFYRMSSDISPQQAKSDDKDLQKSLDESSDSIFVCRACYTAISRRSDQISHGYYDKSLNEIRDAESRLNGRINALQSQVNSLNVRIR